MFYEDEQISKFIYSLTIKTGSGTESLDDCILINKLPVGLSATESLVYVESEIRKLVKQALLHRG